MPPHLLTNFEIQKYHQNENRFKDVHSRDKLPKRNSVERSSTECNSIEIKDEAYIINLDEYSDIGAHWIAFHVQNNDVTYFDSFGVEYILKRIKTFISNKNIKTNIFRIQVYDLIMCG